MSRLPDAGQQACYTDLAVRCACCQPTLGAGRQTSDGRRSDGDLQYTVRELIAVHFHLRVDGRRQPDHTAVAHGY